MKVSVITPTEDRIDLLQGAYDLLCKQSHTQWEWLIYDTSLRPLNFSDPRIRYIYDTERVSIGEKRNRLIEKASGDYIVHFDDDDYYAPTYLESIVHTLEHCEFTTTHAWFSYDTKTKQFFYWDSEEIGGVRYHVSAISGLTLKEIDLGPYMQEHKAQLNYKGKTGYGFSFAYRKAIAQTCHFEDIDLAEDRLFYENLEQHGFTICTSPDYQGKLVHVLHDTNTSSEFPQYRIPHFLVKNLCPLFFEYLAISHEKN